MPIIERPDLMHKRRGIPPAVKLILLAAVLIGFYLRSCWYDRQVLYYEISDIELSDQTMSSVDVYFFVTNNTKMSKEESIIIRLYTDTGYEIASRITSIRIQPRSRVRYRKMIEKWSRRLYEDEQLSHATVELYKPSIF